MKTLLSLSKVYWVNDEATLYGHLKALQVAKITKDKKGALISVKLLLFIIMLIVVWW